jgi:hypothetical protein
MGLYFTTIPTEDKRVEFDLHRLQVAGKYCRDLSQAELYRALRGIVPGISACDGHQSLCQQYAEWMAKATVKET